MNRVAAIARRRSMQSCFQRRVTSCPCRSHRPRRTLEKTEGGAVATQTEHLAAWIVAGIVIVIAAAYFLLILIGSDVPSPF